MNKMIVFASLAFLLTQCKPEPGISKIPEGKEDGYVFYKGLRRFLSDGTEIEPLLTAISIDGEQIDIGSEENRERIVSVRKDQDRLDCYYAPSEDAGFYYFSFDFPTGNMSEPRPVIGNPDSIGSTRFPGTRDIRYFWESEEGYQREGILRDGVAYAVGRMNTILHVSNRGEYELFDEGSKTYLAYRPFGEQANLGERTIIKKRDGICFVEMDPSSPERYFFTNGSNPRWYCFDEETLELKDLGAYEKNRYRFLSLHYEGEPGYCFGNGESTATRYIVEEGARTLVKDLADPSYLLDVTDKIPQVEDLQFAGYSEDMGFFYYSLWDERQSGDGYLESEQRWVGADITNRMKDEKDQLVRWNFSYPYLKTDRYDFWVDVDNEYRFLDVCLNATYRMIRDDLETEETYYAQIDRFSPSPIGFMLQTPFLYDYVDTQGDEILEIGPSLAPMMNAPK